LRTDALAGDAELPAPVRATRHALLRAALIGDWSTLDSLSRRSETFRFTFGDPGTSPVAYWIEYGGGSVLNDLAFLLSTEPAPVGRGYVWPGWSGKPWEALSPEERAALRCGAGVEAADDMALDERYRWLRTSITANGTWAYFIGGD
jgi:hypothetical protein